MAVCECRKNNYKKVNITHIMRIWFNVSSRGRVNSVFAVVLFFELGAISSNGAFCTVDTVLVDIKHIVCKDLLNM